MNVVADRELPVQGPREEALALRVGDEEGAAVAEVPYSPAVAVGEEGVLEDSGGVGEVGEGAGGGGGWMGRLGRDEGLPREAEERRRVGGAEAVEEGVAGDDAAEGGAGGGRAGEVGGSRDAEEDILEEIVGEGLRRRGHCGYLGSALESAGSLGWRPNGGEGEESGGESITAVRSRPSARRLRWPAYKCLGRGCRSA